MDPLSAISLGATVFKGIGSIFSQQGENDNQRAMIDYQNRSRLRAWNDQLKIRQFNALQQNAIYGQKLSQYQQNLFNIDRGLADAYLKEDMQMRENFKAAAFAEQGSLASQIESSGKLKAGLQSGRSSARAVALNQAKYGRNTAVLMESLRSKQLASQQRAKGYLRDANAARMNAWSQVAIAPQQAPMPSAPLPIPYNTRANNTNMFGTVLGAVGDIAGAAAGMDWGGGASPTPNADALKIPSYSNFAGSGVFGLGGFGPS